MRVLPKDQREAMFSVYRFCRAVDDVADEPEFGSRSKRGTRFSDGAGIAALFEGRRGRSSPTSRARSAALLCDAKISRPSSPGSRWTPKPTSGPPDWATLDLYSDRVACAVGRLSVRVFGFGARRETRSPSTSGRALQLTNILRDLDEDAAAGRLYLPA